MKRSQLFTKVTKTSPADEPSNNAQLLIRAGYINKEMAGVYSYLPLGLMVLENIKKIIRDEMSKIDANEILMTHLQPADTWQSTGRWDDKTVDIWFKTKLKTEEEIGLAWSHEEPIIRMLQNQVHSYKDLPVAVYQFQTKLRNELRAKSGIMRGREFLMKDLYSAHATKEDLDAYYQKVIQAYNHIFKRLGIGDKTYMTFASGGAFTEFSHEFQTICPAGEDWLYLDETTGKAVNQEVLDQAVDKLGLDKNKLLKLRSAEVGNIFNFGTSKAEQMGFKFASIDNQLKPTWFGSYGIGVSRVMGVIAEICSDNRGLIWPMSIAPYQVYLINAQDDPLVIAKTKEIYDWLKSDGKTVLWDDRSVRPGEKFADADLLGIPIRLVVSRKLLDQGLVEIKERSESMVELSHDYSMIDNITGIIGNQLSRLQCL